MTTASGASPRFAVPLGFLAVFFAWPLGAILSRSLRAGAVADVLTTGSYRHVAWFTLWQAVVSTVLTLVVGLPAAYVVARYRVPGPALLPRVRHGAVRAADRRGRDRVPRTVAARRPAGVPRIGSAESPRCSSAHVFFNVAVVVRTVGGFWVEPRSSPRGGGAHARRLTDACVPLRDAAVARAVDPRRRVDRVPLHVHVVRRGVAARRPGPRDDRGRDLPPGRRACSICTPRPRSRSCRSSRCCSSSYRLSGSQERRAIRAAACRGRGHGAAAARPRVARGRRRARRDVAVPRRSAARARPAITARRRALEHRLRTARSGRARRRRRCSSRRGPRCATRSSSRRSPPRSRSSSAASRRSSIASRPGRGTRSMDALLMLPLGTSAVTVGLRLSPRIPEPSTRSRHLTAARTDCAQAVVAIPFVVRAVVPALRSIDPRLRDAATSARRVPAPRVARGRPADRQRGVRGGGGILRRGVAGRIRRDVVRRSSRTARRFPIAIQRFLARPGDVNVGQALAMSVILMALTLVVILAIERPRIGRFGAL